MFKISAFGAAGEVGRSCVLIDDGERRVLLDCGVKIVPKERSLPPSGIEEVVREEGIDSVILSHAHLDHTGYTPRLFQEGYNGVVHATPPTRDISHILWLDHLKIEKEEHYLTSFLETALFSMSLHDYREKFRVCDGVIAEFFDAGHILGSSSILLDWDGVLIWYTGDINTSKTPFHDGAKFPDEEDIDIVISESTNGTRDFPSRKVVEEDFGRDITEVLERGGKVIAPSFAVGRSQEVAMTIARWVDIKGLDAQVYLDGMIRYVNEIYLNYLDEKWVSPRFLSWLKDQGLSSPFEMEYLREIDESIKRKEAFRKQISKNADPCVIITTSGMMEGGPVHSYLRYACTDPKNMLAIVGFQVEGTLGREIMEGRRQIVATNGFGNGYSVEIKSKVKRFHFSGHSPRLGLQEYLLLLDAKNYLFVHGDSESCYALEKYVKHETVHSNGEVKTLKRIEPAVIPS